MRLLVRRAPVPAPTPLALDERGAHDDITGAIGGPGNDLPPLLRPVMRGEGGVRLRTGTLLLDGQSRPASASRGGPATTTPLSFDESAISAPLGAGRIYASVERRHWGPSWTGSLILDAGARPVPAIGWRKDDPGRSPTAPFSWLGPWRIDAVHRRS